MDNKKKVINAIKNFNQRKAELAETKAKVKEAETNTKNAEADVIRQIRNAFGTKSVVFDGLVYTAASDKLGYVLEIRSLGAVVLEE